MIACRRRGARCSGCWAHCAARCGGAAERASRRRVDKPAGRAGLPPRVVLLLDGYAGFVAAFERARLGEPVQALHAARGRRASARHARRRDQRDRRADVPGAPGGRARRAGRAAAWPTTTITPRWVSRARRSPARSCRPGAASPATGTTVQIAWVGSDGVAGVARRAAEAHPGQAAPARRAAARARRARRPAGAPDGPLAAVVGARRRPARARRRQTSREEHFLVAGPHAFRRKHRAGHDRRVAARRLARARAATCSRRDDRRSPALDIWTSAAQGLDACAELAARARRRGRAAASSSIDDALELAEGPARRRSRRCCAAGATRGVRLVAAVDDARRPAGVRRLAARAARGAPRPAAAGRAPRRRRDRSASGSRSPSARCRPAAATSSSAARRELIQVATG